MKQYKLFQHPSGEVEALKQGWSWPAFFFSSIWALVKKLWVIGACVLAFFVVLGSILGAVGVDQTIINMMAYLIGIPVNVIFGLKGNSWREKALLSRGYEYKDTLTAANPEGAIALFLKGHIPAGVDLASQRG